MPTKALKKEKLHSYITRDPKICGGEPILAGTRISVRLIVEWENTGKSVDEIVAMYPHITHAQVYDALSYYYDHKEEIDRYIQENTEEFVREKYKRINISDGYMY
ncbi:MAG: DUF433 domain-containing protein [Nitrospirae bacterium]|nr:DUF433 domain-containing protein [Nitrospirota bacterium]